LFLFHLANIRNWRPFAKDLFDEEHAALHDCQRTGLGEGGEIEFRPPGTTAD